MKKIVSLLLWIWQAPQNVVGLAFRLFLRRRTVARTKMNGETYCVVPGFGGGISLGTTIIVCRGWLEDENMWMHEYGHARQSRYLGPFYLLAIGLPSLCWAWIWTPALAVSYYAFFTEKWADRLGGVKR